MNDTSIPIDGEVITIERAVSTDLLPPSKDEKLRELQRLSPEQQVENVTEMLVSSRAGLLLAIAAQDLPGIAEAKQKAATILEIAKQVRVGKDMQLEAQEFCRRAERGLGVAIREGQARGDVRTRGQKVNQGNQHGELLDKKNTNHGPTDYASISELNGPRGDTGIYAMTDGVSDEQFEEAIAEARDEGNMSRANVARKAKAKASAANEVMTGDLTASEIIRRAAEVPPEPGKHRHEAICDHFGVSRGTYTRIKQVHDAAEGDPVEKVRQYAADLMGDLDTKRTTPAAAVTALERFRKEHGGGPRPFKKSDVEMLAEIAGSLENYAGLIIHVRPSHIEAEDAQRLATQARNAMRAISKALKEIEK